MAGKRLKRLARLRLILSVIAVLLAGLMVVSGAMHIFAGKKPGVEKVCETTEPKQETQGSTQTQTDPNETQWYRDPTETIPMMPGGQNQPDWPNQSWDKTETFPVEDGNASPTSTQPENDSNSVTEGNDEEGIVETGPSSAVETTSEYSKNSAETGTIGGQNEEIYETIGAVIPWVTEGVANLPAIAETVPEVEKPGTNIWGTLFWISATLLAGDLIAILFLSYRMDSVAKSGTTAQKKPLLVSNRKRLQSASIGTVHQMGRRGYQQDSLGHSAVFGGNGILAVLADGMGGLSDGDKVSQKVVMEMLTLGQKLTSGRTNGVLKKMLAQVNENVNQALGTNGLYKSGSTMVAVLVQGTEFQWIAVGDSRIYLYRQGYVNQLNQDHDQLQVWMAEVLEGKRSIEDALHNPDGRKLTSFIGMGQLKYVDASLNAIGLEPGDRLVLMSDGVYNVIGEDRLAAILKQCPDVNRAASTIERLIEETQNPHQDNYTAMILGF